MGDKIGKFLGFNPVLENILVMKVAIILIAISLVISSLALLFLALSHHRLKNPSSSLRPVPDHSAQNDRPDEANPAIMIFGQCS